MKSIAIFSFIINEVTQVMKRHAMIIAICMKYTILNICNFLNCVLLFVHNIHCELKASVGNAEIIVKCKKHKEYSDTMSFVQLVQEIVDYNHSIFMRVIIRDLDASEGLIH